MVEKRIIDSVNNIFHLLLQLAIHSDACPKSRGDCMLKTLNWGNWSKKESYLRTNVLEMVAAYFAVKM